MNIKKALDKIPGARRIYSLYRHLESFPCPEQNESLSQQCQKILINQYTMARLKVMMLFSLPSNRNPRPILRNPA
jgi:hypothetical protein